MKSSTDSIEMLPNGKILITIKYIFAHKGKRRYIIPIEDKGKEENLDMPVIRMLARAKYWNRKLESGEYKSAQDIANELGIDLSYVSKLVRLGALSPFIVRMFLEGNAPAELSRNKLLSQSLPDSWEEQHKMFGIDF